MAFLQGRDPSLAYRIGSRAFCPEGPSFVTLQVYGDLLGQGFGPLAFQDRAKLLAVLFLITTTVDENFTVWRYGERLVGPDFGPLAAKLAREPSLIDQELLDLWTPILKKHRPNLVDLTVPFPGNCYVAHRLAKTVPRGPAQGQNRPRRRVRQRLSAGPGRARRLRVRGLRDTR